jgi:hypothetical protein
MAVKIWSWRNVRRMAFCRLNGFKFYRSGK